MAGSRYLNLRWPSQCVVCGTTLSAGTEAWWDVDTRTVKCVDCRIQIPEVELSTAPAVVPSVAISNAGASARREYERRRARYEAGVRSQHPIVGGALLKLQREPPSVAVWARGAEGE